MKIVYLERFTHVHHELPKVEALRGLGHEVVAVEEGSILDTDQVFRHNPDLILFAKLKMNVATRLQLVAEAKDAGIKTACWIPDLYFGLTRQRQITLMKDAIFQADYVFTPDGGHDRQWKDAKVNHYLLRQGFPVDYYYRGGKVKCPEIVFVGAQNEEWTYRKKLCNFLVQHYGGRFRWYGRHNTEEARGHKLNELYNSAKIVIGDSVYSPHYWSNRIYETLGRGGFLIHPHVEGLADEYEPYKEFIPYNFNDLTSLKDKIDHFLSHDDEREVIQQAGFERTRDYLLAERCKQFLKVVT